MNSPDHTVELIASLTSEQPTRQYAETKHPTRAPLVARMAVVRGMNNANRLARIFSIEAAGQSRNRASTRIGRNILESTGSLMSLMLVHGSDTVDIDSYSRFEAAVYIGSRGVMARYQALHIDTDELFDNDFSDSTNGDPAMLLPNSHAVAELTALVPEWGEQRARHDAKLRISFASPASPLVTKMQQYVFYDEERLLALNERLAELQT